MNSHSDLEKTRSTRGWQRGQALVEFALILSLLLLLVMGIIDFSRAFIVYTNLFSAAREGTRFGAVHPWSPGSVENTVLASANANLVDRNGMEIIVCCDTGPGMASFYCDPDTMDAGPCTLSSRPNAQGALTGDPAQIGDRVVISVTYIVYPITPIISGLIPELPVQTSSVRTIATLGEAYVPPPAGGGGEGGETVTSCNAGTDGDGDGLTGCTDPDCRSLISCPPVETPGMTLSVSANPTSLVSGASSTFTYIVQNTGNVTLTVTIADGFGNNIVAGPLPPGQVSTQNVTRPIYTTTTNHVTATGAYATGSVTANGSATVTVVGASLDLTVTVNPQTVPTGGTVNYVYTVRNTGNVTLTNVNVDDTLDGTSFFPVDFLYPGSSVEWMVSNYVLRRQTTNTITAWGTPSGGGGAVQDVESVTVYVQFEPIVIHEPLNEGATVVTGTGQATWLIAIRDASDPAFPNTTIPVGTDSEFQFTSLPALTAGHVMVVQGMEGYNKWDSALVGSVNLRPLTMQPHSGVYLCHGQTVITGTGEPGRTVNLTIVGSTYDDSTTVRTNGVYTFSLPATQPLQAGQSAIVSAYGQTVVRGIVACGTASLISINPQCSSTGRVTITVLGQNWPPPGGGMVNIGFQWNGTKAREPIPLTGNNPNFATTIVVTPTTAGTYTVLAQTEKSNGQATGGFTAQASFLVPCPIPNLRVTDLRLLTTGVISTYQPIDFQATIANVGSKPVNSMFWVDLYSPTPITQTPGVGWAAVGSLASGNSITIGLTLQAGFDVTGTHQVWAFADSWDYVRESSEGDNLYGALPVTVTVSGLAPSAWLTGTATIEGDTWVTTNIYPEPHPRATLWCRRQSTGQIVSTTSNDAYQYSFPNLPAGTYTVFAQTWIDGNRYSATATLTVADGETIVWPMVMLKN